MKEERNHGPGGKPVLKEMNYLVLMYVSSIHNITRKKSMNQKVLKIKSHFQLKVTLSKETKNCEGKI